MQLFVDKDIDVLINSPGGVGTTFLIEHIAKYAKTNDPTDCDGLKHPGMPLLSHNKKLKRVFVYGDVKLAVVSLFNRGYHNFQSYKLQLMLCEEINYVPNEMSLSEYLLDDRDLFMFDEQFTSFHEKYNFCEQLFVKYEAVHDYAKQIVEYLELPSDALLSFPKKKTRRSKLEELDDETRAALDRKYSAIQNRFDNMPDFEILPPRKVIGPTRVLLTEQIYRRFLAKVMAHKARTCLRNARSKNTD